MTGLRDARLRKALDDAPGAGWRRGRPPHGQAVTPWLAAFASLVLAMLVVLLWQGQEAPGARLDGSVAQAPVPPPAVTPVPATAPPASAAAAAPPAHAAADAAPAAPAPAATQAAREEARAAAAAPAVLRRSAPAALPWTQVRIEAGARSVVIPRRQAGALPALVTSMLASPSDEAQPGSAAALRLELAQGDEAAGALELVDARWRWRPLRDARGPRMLRADPAVADALQKQAEALLGR